MPSLKDLRNRITSVKSTQKITKAMKMVAAAKLRKAQENAEKGRAYSDKMKQIVNNLKKNTSAPKLLVGTGKGDTILCIVMTADRGLCGGFNTNIVKKSKEYFDEIINSNKKLKIITVGSKGNDQLKRIYKDYIIKKISYKNIKNISINEASELTSQVIDMYYKDEFDVCTIFYNKFKSVISQEPQAQQIIPVEGLEQNNDDEQIKEQYEFEPDETEILEYLLPQNITTQIYKAFLENAASEQGSRMSAMDNATRNAGDLIDKLTINYNRSRQAVITKELIEIISGAESL